MLKKNDIIKTTITDWSSDGNGICRIDGMVVFVSSGVPGDECHVRILKVSKTHAFAKIEQLDIPSEDRIRQKCNTYPKCGGCSLRHINYSTELKMKKQKVADCLHRIGGLSIEPSDVVPSPIIDGYRNKVIYQVSEKDSIPVFGFFRKGSHDVIEAKHCFLQDSRSGIAAQEFCDYAHENHIPIYSSKGKGIRYIFYRSTSSGYGQLGIISSSGDIGNRDTLIKRLRKKCPWLLSVFLNINNTPGNVALKGELIPLYGDISLTDELCGLQFNISPFSFYQVNRAQTELLYRRVIELASLSGKEEVIDLYCGIGTISLYAAKYARHVTGVEIVPSAIENAMINASQNGISNVDFICADAGKAASNLQKSRQNIDVLIVDPPRKGLSSETIQAILSISSKKLIYVSCDPATLARDLKELSLGCYSVVSAEPFDMFPRTHHVETVVLLTRKTR